VRFLRLCKEQGFTGDLQEIYRERDFHFFALPGLHGTHDVIASAQKKTDRGRRSRIGAQT